MQKGIKRLFSTLLVALLAGILLSGVGTSTVVIQAEEAVRADQPASADLVPLQVLAITDFHGYLRAYNDKSNGTIWAPQPEGPITVGGAVYMATHIKRLKAGKPNSVVVSAGDNFSGWPFEVWAFQNEPTVEFLNMIGVEVSAVGNHELDQPKDDLIKHMQNGKCFGTRDVDSCFKDSTGKQFHGSNFPYITANIRDARSGQLITKPYFIKRIPDGKGGTIPVGFIGLTVTDTISETTSFQEGDLIADPLVESANKYAEELQDQGVQSIVVILHDGGSAGGYFRGCSSQTGPAFDFARQASPAIDIIITGHWHSAFNCMVNDPDGNPRPVMQGANHGKLITDINLSIDPANKDVVRSLTTVVNVPNTRDVPEDPEVAKMVAYWGKRGSERAAEPVAELTGDLTRARNANGESALADVVADAHYFVGRKAPQPADLALVASSPLSRDIKYAKGSNPADRDGLILFGEQWDSEGYGNPVVVVTLTGRQIDQVLEEQWRAKSDDGTIGFYPLAVSHNVHYSYDASKPLGDRVDPANFIINGKPLDLDKSYRVAALAYLITGNDGYPSFKGYSNPHRVMTDKWAFLEYMQQEKVIVQPKLDRVKSIQP